MRGGTCHSLLALALFVLTLGMQRAEALNPETLLMPGKLSTAHQKYEQDCSKCHAHGDFARQTRLCLDCHEDIAKDIATAKNFHGRIAGISQSQCRACHSEHLGRAGDIVKLSAPQFNHELTEFPLTGIHSTVACGNCHTAGRAYRKTGAGCIDCHQKEEPHEGRLGRDCASCHDTTRWRELHFDHSKTHYPLQDKHAEVPCAGCHFGNRYKGTPQQCVSCHAPNDVHRGERGSKCADCHSPAGWKSKKFDHAQETGFALLGSHAHLDCQDCHRSGNLHDKVPKTCFGCHQGQDAHAGRFDKDCSQCHGNAAWKPTDFEHSRDGHWPLIGKHEKLDCHSCHTAEVAKQKLPHDCVSCHRASDVHATKLGTRCEECHTPKGWRSEVEFDHDLTDFPLLGLHVAVPCEQCHATRKYRDVGRDCIACHKKDDAHKGSLGTECAKCHSPNGWQLWQFDHGKETGFALTGAHGKLTCADCHKQPAGEVKLNQNCLSCHEQDDVHLGQYGRQCQRCHSTLTFKGARLH